MSSTRQKITKNISLLLLVAACMGTAHPMEQKEKSTEKHDAKEEQKRWTNNITQLEDEPSDEEDGFRVSSETLNRVEAGSEEAILCYNDLHDGATSGDLTKVQLSIVKGIKVNSKKDGSTALHKAAAL